MKIILRVPLFVVALLLTAQASAGEHEFGVGYSDINRKFTYNNGESRTYKLDAIEVKYAYWLDNFGVRVSLAKTNTGSNTHIHGEFYEMRIPLLWRVHAAYRYKFTDDVSCSAGAGITEYKTVSHVNGVAPVWSENKDSYKPSYSLGCRYNFNKGYSIEVSYGLDNLSKDTQKREVTTHTSLTLIKRF